MWSNFRVAPAFIAITQMWYRRLEQPMRLGSWYAMNGVVYMVCLLRWAWVVHCLFAEVEFELAVRKSDNLRSWSYTIFSLGAIPGRNSFPLLKANLILTVFLCVLDHIFIFRPHHHRVFLRRAVSGKQMIAMLF